MIETIAKRLSNKFSDKKYVSFFEKFGEGPFEYGVLSILLTWNHNGSEQEISINYSLSSGGITTTVSFDTDESIDDVYSGSSIDEAYTGVIQFLWRYFGSECVHYEQIHKNEI